MYISPKNSKVYAPMFNLPAIKTCKKHLKCHEYCYALRYEKRLNHVKAISANNYKESLKPDFVNMVNAYIIFNKPKYFRIHAAGDFYSKDFTTCLAQQDNNVKCMKNCFKCAESNNTIYFKKH